MEVRIFVFISDFYNFLILNLGFDYISGRLLDLIKASISDSLAFYVAVPFHIKIIKYTVKPVLSGHSKIDKTKVLKTDGS